MNLSAASGCLIGSMVVSSVNTAICLSDDPDGLKLITNSVEDEYRAYPAATKFLPDEVNGFSGS